MHTPLDYPLFAGPYSAPPYLVGKVARRNQACRILQWLVDGVGSEPNM